MFNLLQTIQMIIGVVMVMHNANKYLFKIQKLRLNKIKREYLITLPVLKTTHKSLAIIHNPLFNQKHRNMTVSNHHQLMMIDRIKDRPPFMI